MRPSIPALTSLRLFAALVVVLFHYSLGRPDAFLQVGDFGYQAVTFFFILSGFILVYAHGQLGGELNVSQKHFFKARLLRICPAYYLAIAMIVLLFSVAGVLQRITPMPSVLVLTMLQSWTPPFALSINPPAWSLSNEVFFYLSFPAIWRLNGRIGLAGSLALSAALILIVSYARTLIPSSAAEDWNNFRSYFPILNIPKFMFGVSLGYAFIAAPRSQRIHQAIFLIGFLALIVSRSAATWSENDAALDLSCGLIIFGAADTSGIVGRLLGVRPLVILGEASYATYILHFPVWLWWNHFTRILYQSNWPIAFDLSMYIFLVLGLSVAALFWIERPARRILQTRG